MSRLNNFKISEILMAAFAMFGLIMFLAVFILLKFFARIQLGDFGEYAGAVVATIALFVALGGYIGTSRAQRLEYRAYLRVEIERIYFSKTGNVRAEVRFVNTGRTPARDVQVSFEFQPQNHLGDPIKDPKSRTLELQAVHGDARTNITSAGGFSTGDCDDITYGKLQIQVTAILKYNDVFGAPQEDKFFFAYGGFDWVPDHNDKTKVMKALRPNFDPY